MKMDGRDSAEYQIWEMKGYNGHFEICLIKSLKDKRSIVTCLLQKAKGKNVKGEPENRQ